MDLPVHWATKSGGGARRMEQQMAADERIDVHAHWAVGLPPFAERYSDSRWPSLRFADGTAHLLRNGKTVRTLPPSAWLLEPRLAELDAAGVDRQVLSLIPPLICDWAGASASTEWARRLNHGMAEAVGQHPARFAGMGTVPLSHPDRAVAVLSEARDLGLVGVEVGTTAQDRELDHPDLLEFFQAAGELGMLVFIHPVVLGPEGGWSKRIETFELAYGLEMTTDTAIAGSRLVFGGTLDASPGLALCLAHGGGSFAWALTRVAHVWDAAHERTAADLAHNVYVDSVVFDHRNLRYLVDRLGADHVLFGTDYPMPGSDSLLGTALDQLDETDRKLVEAGSIRALIDLG